MNKFVIELKDGERFKVETEMPGKVINSMLNRGEEWVKIGSSIIRIDEIRVIFECEE